MASPTAKASFLVRLLGCLIVVAGLVALGLGVAFGIVWTTRWWQVVVVAVLGALGGLGLAFGILTYFGHVKRASTGLAATILAVASALATTWISGLAQHQIHGWPGWPFHLGLVAGVAGLVALAVRHQVAWTQRVARAMAGYRATPAGLLRPGQTARVRGEVREVGLAAPVSGRPCAAWSAEILGRLSDDWLILGTARSGARFVLGTDDGPLRVEAASALFARGSNQALLPVARLTDALLRAVEDHPFLKSCVQFNARELRIDGGAKVSVLGKVREDGALSDRDGADLLLEID